MHDSRINAIRLLINRSLTSEEIHLVEQVIDMYGDLVLDQDFYDFLIRVFARRLGLNFDKLDRVEQKKIKSIFRNSKSLEEARKLLEYSIKKSELTTDFVKEI